MSMMDSKPERHTFTRGEYDWPTGFYISRCVKCGKQFMGEKRQRLCVKCIPKPKDS